MEQQPALELWKAKPGPDLPILEVPGFGVALPCEEELKVISVHKVSRGRKPDSYWWTSLVSSGRDSATCGCSHRKECHCRHYARQQWRARGDLRYPH